jgi:hypothetical protein
VVFHGALENADRVRRERPWSPGAFCATERFACSAWWPEVSDLLVVDRHVVTTVADLVADGAPEEFGPRVFVRPDSPLKPFSGRVLDRERIDAAALDHGFYYDDDRLPVVVTPVVDVGEEWRFVVADGAVVAGSGYVADGRRSAGSLDAGHPAWAFAEDAVARLSAPERVFVVDVCETSRGLRLLELNPFSGADLYDCDRRAVVAAVRRTRRGGYRSDMSDAANENLGHLDDAAEEQEASSTTDGAAAEGEYDPAQGSPDSGAHPVGAEFPDEVDKTGQPITDSTQG